MSPLRIALVSPEHPGCGASFGVGAYVAALGGALVAAGCECLVLVVAAEGRFVVHPGQAPRRAGDAPRLAALRPARAAAWLGRELRAWDPALVEYANWGGLGAWDRGPWRRAVRLSTPVAAIDAAGARRLAWPLHRWWERRTVRRADLVIANSRAMASLGRACYRREAHLVIPHGWSGPVEPPAATGDEVLFVGRLEPRKGIDLLPAAWRLARARRPGATLHVVGRDAQGFGARHLAGLPQLGVVLHGQLDDTRLRDLRRRCRIQVIPSRFESFGLVALEAWAGGQAVVAAAAGGLAEVVDDAGLLVAPGDATGLGEALGALLADPARCLELAQRGQRRLAGEFAASAWAARTLAAYRQALQADARHGPGWAGMVDTPV